VFVSSHLLAEVEQICTHAAIMSAGRLVAQGTLAELRGAGQARIRVLTPDPGKAAQVLAGLGLTATLSPDGRTPGGTGYGGAGSGTDAALFASLPGAPSTAAAREDSGSAQAVAPEAVVAALVAAGVRVRGFATEQASLEDRFVALTGEGFDVVQ
jgi:ABC-2 type transport system ATP-binding protein